MGQHPAQGIAAGTKVGNVQCRAEAVFDQTTYLLGRFIRILHAAGPLPASSFEAGDKDTPMALERRQASIKEGAILA
jgi:hypothetical protein